jgi:hypothetical protein
MDPNVYKTSKLENIIILGLLILVEILLFSKLKFKIDMTGIFLLVLNLVVAILRVV